MCFPKKTKKTKVFGHYGVMSVWLAIVAEIFGFWGKTHRFCKLFSRALQMFWFFKENTYVLNTFRRMQSTNFPAEDSEITLSITL